MIWTDPKTGGKVYVGDITSASQKQTLDKCGIKNVINCQGMNSENYHENDPKFTYFRWPIGATLKPVSPSEDGLYPVIFSFA